MSQCIATKLYKPEKVRGKKLRKKSSEKCSSPGSWGCYLLVATGPTVITKDGCDDDP